MATNEECSNCAQLKQIKLLSRQVLKKYDELLEKYKENENQYNEVVKRLKEREAMLEDMKKLIEPAMSEHERLMVKYNIELDCRAEAENIARKMTAQNISLKRQSQALLSHLGKIDITQIPEEILEEPVEEENASYKEYTDSLNAKIKELEEQVSYYSTAYVESQQELSTERDDNKRLKQKNENLKQSIHQTENTLTQYQHAMVELSTMSESAYEEYEHLRKKYEIEAKERNEVEKNILKIKAQNEAMKKQSTILLSKVANDEQLTLALMRMEELENEKSELARQVEDLQKEIDNLGNEERIEELQKEKSSLSADVEELTKKVTNYEHIYASLEKKYKELEHKLEEALRPPPPPPPPLPPPPPTTQSKGFLSRITGKNKKKKEIPRGMPGVVNQEGYSQALAEMMKRINSGQPLKKSSERRTVERRPSEGEKSGAMQELHSVLNRFKRTQNENESIDSNKSPDTVEGIDPESDLAKAFQRVKGRNPLQKSSTLPAKLSIVKENEKDDETKVNDVSDE